MTINVNVNIKLEDTPALINCFSAFVGALEQINSVTLVSVPEASKPAPKKSAKKATQAVEVAPDPEVAEVAPPEVVEPVEAVEPAAEAETTPAITADEVKAACMELIKAHPEKKAALAGCFQAVGATKLSDVPTEKYAQLIELVSAL